ncbi:MAG: hypothetical protein ACOC7L_01235 [Acidobacteriota bacterium]
MAPKQKRPEAGTSEGEAAAETAHVGRRGGKTTATPGSIRKSFWIDQDAEEALHRDAAASGIPKAELLRQVLRRHYGLDDL